MAAEHIKIRLEQYNLIKSELPKFQYILKFIENKKTPNINGQEVAIPVRFKHRTGKLIEFNQNNPEKEPLLERVQKGILSSREESRVVSTTVGHTKISKLIEAFNCLSNTKNGSKYRVFISEWNNLYSLATHNNGSKVLELTIERAAGGALRIYLKEKSNDYLKSKQGVQTVPTFVQETHVAEFNAMKVKYSRVKQLEWLRLRCGFGEFFYESKLPFTELFDKQTVVKLANDILGLQEEDLNRLRQATNSNSWPITEDIWSIWMVMESEQRHMEYMDGDGIRAKPSFFVFVLRSFYQWFMLAILGFNPRRFIDWET
ncbi:hypothetical protein BC833DRAFT_639013 [Globomyces pollinis-pini]|nr:hypothetical protein BC833DRAFT_639013 [Globomyces pollinis-pini]